MARREKKSKRKLFENIGLEEFRQLNKSKDIALALRNILADRKISKEEFAFLMDLDQHAVNQLLNGRQAFNLDTLYRISERLGLL
ncbi:MAG: helix-turn-helix transcriptional regulator [Bacteroidota bacterium]